MVLANCLACSQLAAFCYSVAALPTAGLLVDVQPLSTPSGARCQGPQLSYTITQLTLGIEDKGGLLSRDKTELCWPALQQLPQLASLVELALPVFNAPKGTLAPALSALTSLTKLFIRHPLPPEQQALPLSLKHLTVSREYQYMDAAFPNRLPALQLAHLTTLDTLVICGSHWSAERAVDWFDLYWMCKGVPAGSVTARCCQSVCSMSRSRGYRAYIPCWPSHNLRR